MAICGAMCHDLAVNLNQSKLIRLTLHRIRAAGRARRSGKAGYERPGVSGWRCICRNHSPTSRNRREVRREGNPPNPTARAGEVANVLARRIRSPQARNGGRLCDQRQHASSHRCRVLVAQVNRARDGGWEMNALLQDLTPFGWQTASPSGKRLSAPPAGRCDDCDARWFARPHANSADSVGLPTQVSTHERPCLLCSGSFHFTLLGDSRRQVVPATLPVASLY